MPFTVIPLLAPSPIPNLYHQLGNFSGLLSDFISNKKVPCDKSRKLFQASGEKREIYTNIL